MTFHDLRFSLSKKAWPGDISLPSWEDLALGALPSDEETLGSLLLLLQTGPVVIAAPPNHGKTFLAYQVGRRLVDQYSDSATEVLFAPAIALKYGSSVDEIIRRRETLDANQSEVARPTYVYILDDCHQNEEVASALVKLAFPPALTFLCTIRATTVGALPEWATDIREEDPARVFFRRYDARLAEAIAKTYIRRTEHLPQAKSALDAFTGALGGDLSRLVYGLRAWAADTTVPIEDVNEATIVDFTRREFAVDQLDPLRARALHLLATLGVHEFPVALELIPETCAGAVRDLVAQGLARWTPGPRPGYLLVDQKACPWVLSALARYCGSLPLTQEPDVLTEYCAKMPPTLGLSLVRSLVSEDRIALARAVLSRPEAVAQISKGIDSLGVKKLADKLSEIISGLPREDRALAVSLIGPRAANELRIGIRGLNANRLRAALVLLNATGELQGALRSLTADDWRATIHASTLNGLKMLMYSLRMAGQKAMVRRLAEHLARVELEPVLARSVSGHAGLRGLLYNLLTDAPTTVGPFLDRLSRTKLEEFIRRAAPVDVADLAYCFLQNASSDIGQRFVSNNERALADVLRRASPSDSLWLLWNIFSIEPSAAERLAVSAQLPLPDDPSYLPLYGLMTLCHRPLDALVVPSVEPLVEALSAERSPTVFGLTLRGVLASGNLETARRVVERLLPDVRNRFAAARVFKVKALVEAVLVECGSGR